MGSKKRPISVSQMSSLLGFSRSHFYSLMKKNVFPKPVLIGARPMFTPELQDLCFEVKATGVAASGAFVYFNEKQKATITTKQKKRASKYSDLIESLKALGLERVTSSLVEDAIKDLYPSGDPDLESPDAIKAIFLHLRQ